MQLIYKQHHKLVLSYDELVKLAINSSILFRKFLPSILSHLTSLNGPPKFSHFLSFTSWPLKKSFRGEWAMLTWTFPWGSHRIAINLRIHENFHYSCTNAYSRYRTEKPTCRRGATPVCWNWRYPKVPHCRYQDGACWPEVAIPYFSLYSELRPFDGGISANQVHISIPLTDG